MIIPATTATTQPIAYSGGQESTSGPNFGASLQATLVQLQATTPGTAAMMGPAAGKHQGQDGSGPSFPSLSGAPTV